MFASKFQNAEAPQGRRVNPRAKSANAGSLSGIAIVSPKTGGGNWLRNGNRPGDPNNAPRCGAKTRKAAPCRSPAMPNGRCRMHGGSSTGPRTPAGLEKSRSARWKHGRYSNAIHLQRRRDRSLLTMIRYFAGRLRDKQEIASITARLDQSLTPLRGENRDQQRKTTAPNSASVASWLAQLLKELVAARVAWGPSSFQQLTAQIVPQKVPGRSMRSLPKLT